MRQLNYRSFRDMQQEIVSHFITASTGSLNRPPRPVDVSEAHTCAIFATFWQLSRKELGDGKPFRVEAFKRSHIRSNIERLNQLYEDSRAYNLTTRHNFIYFNASFFCSDIPFCFVRVCVHVKAVLLGLFASRGACRDVFYWETTLINYNACSATNKLDLIKEYINLLTQLIDKKSEHKQNWAGFPAKHKNVLSNEMREIYLSTNNQRHETLYYACVCVKGGRVREKTKLSFFFIQSWVRTRSFSHVIGKINCLPTRESQLHFQCLHGSGCASGLLQKRLTYIILGHLTKIWDFIRVLKTGRCLRTILFNCLTEPSNCSVQRGDRHL